MGVGVVAGRRIKIVRNTIVDTVSTPSTSSPIPPARPASRTCSSRTTTSPATGGPEHDELVRGRRPAVGRGTAVMDGLTVTGNRVHVGPATANNGNADGLGGLGIRADKANLKRNVVITNNWTVDNDTRSTTRVVINLANVQNLTITGNRQPIANGSASSATPAPPAPAWSAATTSRHNRNTTSAGPGTGAPCAGRSPARVPPSSYAIRRWRSSCAGG